MSYRILSKLLRLRYDITVIMIYLSQLVFNLLTTDDAIWRRLTLAACYQLAQSILKIGFALAKKAG